MSRVRNETIFQCEEDERGVDEGANESPVINEEVD
jgi:hypothetical protein